MTMARLAGMLRTGCSVVTITVVTAPAYTASFAPPYVPPTTVSVGAVPRWVPVCGRGRPIGSGSWDNTDTFVFDSSACTIPNTFGVKALRLSYMGSDISNVGEIPRQATFTGDAAIAIPSTSFSAIVVGTVASGSTSLNVQVAQGSSGNGVDVGLGIVGTNIAPGSWITSVLPVVSSSNVVTLTLTFSNSAGTTSTMGSLTAGQVLTITGRSYKATWGDAQTISIVPARHFYDSDPIGAALLPLTQFFVRGSWTVSASGFYVGDYPSPSSGSTRLTGEGSQRSTSSLTDHTMDTYVPSNSGGGFFSPWTVLGQVTQPMPSLLLVGDSICAGTGDAADSYGHMGYLERSLGQLVPWASLCRGSTSALQLSVNLQLIQQAAAEISATDVLLEYGRNDINASGNPQTASATETSLETIASPLVAAGYRVWVFTVPPTTDSTDGWTTANGQFLQQQASATTAATSAGTSGSAITLALTSTSGIQGGEFVGYQNATSSIIPDGTTVTAVNSSTSLTIAPPANSIVGAIPMGTTLGFGTRSVSSSGTPVEYQREQYNTWCRSSAKAWGFAGCIDDDTSLEDPMNIGLWRSDLGSASLEGIHPSAALHSAIVAAGIITPALFPAR